MITDVLPAAGRMVVDLAGVTALHSDTLGELALTHMWAEAAGYALKFAAPREPVRRLLENTNLILILDVYPSISEAVAAMPQEAGHTA